MTAIVNYSADIVVIDRFFYSRIQQPSHLHPPRSYGLKLSYPRPRNQPTSFLRPACKKRFTTLSGDFENDSPQRPTLRELFLETVKPANVGCPLGNADWWIMAVRDSKFQRWWSGRCEHRLTRQSQLRGARPLHAPLPPGGTRDASNPLYAPPRSSHHQQNSQYFTFMPPILTHAIPSSTSFPLPPPTTQSPTSPNTH